MRIMTRIRSVKAAVNWAKPMRKWYKKLQESSVGERGKTLVIQKIQHTYELNDAKKLRFWANKNPPVPKHRRVVSPLERKINAC